MTSDAPDPSGQEVAPPQGSGGVAAPAAVPLDADDTRSTHLRRLLVHPLTLSLGITLLIAAFVGGTVGAGTAIGAAAAAAAVLLVFLIVFVLASNAAKEDFFSAYANARGLARRPGRGPLPPSTPLLRKGDKRYAEEIMNGNLPGGLPGAIGLYTYEEKQRDADGDESTDYYRFTVVMHDVPAAAPKASDVYCNRRSGFRFMDSTEDVFRRMKRLELESEALDKRYEIFYGSGDEENWMKQLFSPSFIVWLAEAAPKDFAFEFSAGALCCNVKGHKDSAAELDTICEAAGKVARRLAEEASE